MTNPYYQSYWKDNNELEHYGILGMKWGIRRTPEQLGHHRIRKGTKVYRVTSSNNVTSHGPTYVTYLPPDRDFYRGSYANVLKKQQGGTEADKIQETSYKLTEDLNIPSRKELGEAYKAAMNDPEVLKEACLARAETFVQRRCDQKYSHLDKYNVMRPAVVKSFMKSYMNEYGSYPPDEAFIFTARALTNGSPIIKDAIIKKLSEKGYNAMVDEAGVGGVVSPREGVEPLIIFDANKSMKSVGSKEITAKSQHEADLRRHQWYIVATSERNKNKPW